MQAKVFEGIDNVDQNLWDRVTLGHPYAGWHWCRYGEAILKHPGYFLIAFEGDEPVGGAIFWVIYDEPVPTTHRAVRWLTSRYLNWRPLTVCRTPRLTDHKGVFLPSDPVQRTQVLSEIRRVGMDIAHRHRSSFLLADYLDEGELDYDAWGDFLRLKDFLNVGTWMHVRWNTFEEFMAALKTSDKKMHKNVRHNLRYAQEEGITIAIGHQMPPLEDVCRLVATKMKHYNIPFRRSELMQIIDALPMLAENSAIWVTAHRNGEMVGCELLLHDSINHVCKPVLYGRSYDVEFVYFYMCYEDIRYAIEELRVQTIIYDTEAYDFKRRMGFEIDSRNHLVLHPVSRIERALTGVLSRFMND